jgi:riboflavin biosynthesis pyrimidine reductase
VEAGAGLVRSLHAEGLINDVWVFTAPHTIGDAGPRSMAPMNAAALAGLPCMWDGTRGVDAVELRRVGG